jgi:hypothetical protein
MMNSITADRPGGTPRSQKLRLLERSVPRQDYAQATPVMPWYMAAKNVAAARLAGRGPP